MSSGFAISFFLSLLPFAGLLLVPLRELRFHQPIQFVQGHRANDLADTKVFVTNRLSIGILGRHVTTFLPITPYRLTTAFTCRPAARNMMSRKTVMPARSSATLCWPHLLCQVPELGCCTTAANRRFQSP